MDEIELENGLEAFFKKHKMVFYTKDIASTGVQTILVNVPSGAATEVDKIRKMHGGIRRLIMLSATAFAVWAGNGIPNAQQFPEYPTQVYWDLPIDPEQLFLYQNSGSAINVMIMVLGGV